MVDVVEVLGRIEVLPNNKVRFHQKNAVIKVRSNVHSIGVLPPLLKGIEVPRWTEPIPKDISIDRKRAATRKIPVFRDMPRDMGDTKTTRERVSNILRSKRHLNEGTIEPARARTYQGDRLDGPKRFSDESEDDLIVNDRRPSRGQPRMVTRPVKASVRNEKPRVRPDRSLSPQRMRRGMDDEYFVSGSSRASSPPDHLSAASYSADSSPVLSPFRATESPISRHRTSLRYDTVGAADITRSPQSRYTLNRNDESTMAVYSESSSTDGNFELIRGSARLRHDIRLRWDPSYSPQEHKIRQGNLKATYDMKGDETSESSSRSYEIRLPLVLDESNEPRKVRQPLSREAKRGVSSEEEFARTMEYVRQHALKGPANDSVQNRGYRDANEEREEYVEWGPRSDISRRDDSGRTIRRPSEEAREEPDDSKSDKRRRSPEALEGAVYSKRAEEGLRELRKRSVGGELSIIGETDRDAPNSHSGRTGVRDSYSSRPSEGRFSIRQDETAIEAAMSPAEREDSLTLLHPTSRMRSEVLSEDEITRQGEYEDQQESMRFVTESRPRIRNHDLASALSPVTKKEIEQSDDNDEEEKARRNIELASFRPIPDLSAEQQPSAMPEEEQATLTLQVQEDNQVFASPNFPTHDWAMLVEAFVIRLIEKCEPLLKSLSEGALLRSADDQQTRVLPEDVLAELQEELLGRQVGARQMVLNALDPILTRKKRMRGAQSLEVALSTDPSLAQEIFQMLRREYEGDMWGMLDGEVIDLISRVQKLARLDLDVASDHVIAESDMRAVEENYQTSVREVQRTTFLAVDATLVQLYPGILTGFAPPSTLRKDVSLKELVRFGRKPLQNGWKKLAEEISKRLVRFDHVHVPGLDITDEYCWVVGDGLARRCVLEEERMWLEMDGEEQKVLDEVATGLVDLLEEQVNLELNALLDLEQSRRETTTRMWDDV